MKPAMIWLALFALAAAACGNDANDSDPKSDSPDDDGVDNICEDAGAVEDFDPIIEGTWTEATWTDPSTGLMWETSQSLVPGGTWQENRDHCSVLALGGFDDWRLPRLSEYRSLIRCCGETQPGGDCRMTDQCADYDTCHDESCLGCEHAQGPSQGCYWPKALSGACAQYLSSTPAVDTEIAAWFIRFSDGRIDSGGTVEDYFEVRCVRGDWAEKSG